MTDRLQGGDIEVGDGELPQAVLREGVLFTKRPEPLRLIHERLLKDISHETSVAEVRLPAHGGKLRAAMRHDLLCERVALLVCDQPQDLRKFIRCVVGEAHVECDTAPQSLVGI